MPKTINRISAVAVKKATGKTWDEWVKILDKEGAPKMSHKEIALLLYNKGYIKNGWWCQMVTVGYLYARGRRISGQTETAGFEIGVQKTLPVSAKKVWQFITSGAGKKLWGGDARIKIRTVKPFERLRLTWQPKGWQTPTTLQISLTCPRNTPNKTMIRFHQEKLPNIKMREQMRKHWQNVLAQLNKLL